MMQPTKKPAVDVMLAIGNKPKPPMMKGGPMGSMADKPDAEGADDPDAAEDADTSACLKRIESSLSKIMEALQIEPDEAEQPMDQTEVE